MFSALTRRDFVANTVKVGALAGLGDFAFLRNLTPVSAADAKILPAKAQVNPDVEPLVRLVEDTPREKLLEAVADKIRHGTSYQQLLTAVFLAGVRSIQPRPVGFKFHAVLVINSAHLASLAAPDSDRWLPLLWALDNFKDSQAQNQKQGDWFMSAVDDSKLPPGAQAKERFIEAMDNWDEEGADRAIAALVRRAGADEVIELFWRYGARDFRDIGHKAIYAANAWRTMQAIGWRHAEPVMRSLAYALLEHSGSNPAKGDAEADRPWRENLGRAGKIRANWQRGTLKPEAGAELLAALRTASASEASAKVVELLNKEIDPTCLWDGIFMRAGELIMQQPGIVGIHCVTSVNALHYAFEASGNDETRRMLLLQAPAFLALFHKAMKPREDLHLDTLETAELKTSGPDAIQEILADVSKDRMVAARKTVTLMQSQPDQAPALLTAARRLIFSKGTNSHDYKFASAALEDYYHTSAPWRARYLATSMFNLKGSGDKDNRLIERARGSLG